MARVKLELGSKTFGRLVEVAVAERRSVDMQAEMMLMRALGTQIADQLTDAAGVRRIANSPINAGLRRQSMPRPSSLSALWAELLKPRPELFVTESESDSELKPEPKTLGVN
jgi:hypothetical protein